MAKTTIAPIDITCTKHANSNLPSSPLGSSSTSTATKRARPKSSSTASSSLRAQGRQGGRGRLRAARQEGRRRRHRLRRSGLEAGRADRNEAPRRRPAASLPPGVRLLDPPGARPAALRRPLQLRRVLGLRLRDPDGHAGRSARDRGVAQALRAAGVSVSQPRDAHLRQRPGGGHPPGRRPAGDLFQQAHCPQGGPGAGAAVHPADVGRPVRRRHRAVGAIPRHQAAGRLQGAARQLRSAGRAVRGHEHAGRHVAAGDFRASITSTADCSPIRPGSSFIPTSLPN